MSAERIRINTDYNDYYVVTKQQSETQLLNAKKFFDKMKKYIGITFGVNYTN